jgi:hypothetical protein
METSSPLTRRSDGPLATTEYKRGIPNASGSLDGVSESQYVTPADEFSKRRAREVAGQPAPMRDQDSFAP